MSKQDYSFSQALLWGVFKCISLLPLGAARVVGSGLGYLLLGLNTRAVRVTRRNIEICFAHLSEPERQQLVRQSTLETSRLAVETPGIWMRAPAYTAARVVAIEGESLIKDELAKKQGVVLLAPHIGNWEVVGLMLPQYSPVTSLYQPPDLAVLEPIIRQSREKSGAKLVPTNRKGVSALLKALKAGEMVGILPDQVPDQQGGGAVANFFDVPAVTMTLACNLVSRTGCRVVMGVAERVPGGYKLVFSLPDPEIYQDDTDESLLALNRSVENCVWAAPSQYQWQYKRFKRRPSEYENLYLNLK